MNQDDKGLVFPLPFPSPGPNRQGNKPGGVGVLIYSLVQLVFFLKAVNCPLFSQG